MRRALLPTDRAPAARWIPLLLVLATCAAFAPLRQCDFTEWDDPSTVARNPDFNPPTVPRVARYWREPHMGLYVPVTYTAWGAIAAVAGGELPNRVGSQLKASVFHTANLILHLLSTLLVYAILRRLVGSDWPSAAGALLFAIHPVQVESVAWVSGLKDLLCGLLVLTALWQYLRATTSPGAPEARTRACLATLAYVAAMLAKPTAAMTPLIAVALDRWVVGARRGAMSHACVGMSFSNPQICPRKRGAWHPTLRALPLLWSTLAIPILLVAAKVQTVGSVAPVAPWLRPLVAGDALAFYLRQMAAPVSLAVDYGRRPGVVLASPGAYVAWLIPAAIGLLVWRGRRARPWLLGASLAFVAPLLPVLGLRPFMMQYASTVADHYLYLPLFGIALAAAFALARLNGRWVPLTCAALAVILIARSAVQAGYWKDDETLCRHTLAVNPDSFTAHINLGHDLELAGRFAEERDQFAEAVRCNPGFPLARGNLAVIEATLGHLDAAETQCRALMRLAAALPPRGQQPFVPTYAFLGRQLMWHAADPARALPYLTEALRLAPDHPDATADLAAVRAAVAARADARED